MIAETFEYKGHTVEIHYDEDGANPRDDGCMVGTFVGFQSRQYIVGDEQIDPREITLDCTCDGGEVTFPVMGEQITRTCTHCDGWGYRHVESFADMVEYINAHYDVVGDVYPVSRYEHSGVAYSLGTAASSGDRWDTCDAGVIFATPKQIEDTGVPLDQIEIALRGEIEEYSRWANGEVYGYVIKDPNGDETDDSCWGLIGMEWAEEAAKEAVPDTVPAKLHVARFTDVQLDSIEGALRMAADQGFGDADTLAAVRKIRPTDTDPE